MLHIRRGRQSSFYLPKIIPILGIVLFFLALVANAWTLSARALAPGISEEETSVSKATPAAVPDATVKKDTIAATATPVAMTVSVPEASTCSTTQAYRSPAIVDLSVAHDGLTAIVSAPYTYTVSASSLSGLRSGITNCPIRAQTAGPFHAITARQVAWSYGFSQSGGQCKIANVKVGLHITQLLPDFAPRAGTPQSVIDAWNSYHANLVTHENGHIDVAKRYTNELVERLNALGTTDCPTLQLQAKAVVDSELSALNTADTAYDSNTNHGATQGAVL